ncbi:MAG: esterase family protein [Acidobacteriaceae bacterium]|nr:esterase family protein [Acidobacteriaceae bacterium]
MKKLLLISQLAATALFAQQPPLPQSPDVHADGRVTFRFRDPNALKVAVNIEGIKDPLPMQKDEQGLWSVTTDPLKPDLYGYSFDADGVHLLDPSNPLMKPNLLNQSNVVRVPGASPLPWEPANIPHGTIHHHFYKSAIVGDNRDFYVYTPPGYDPNASARYPVLYLLHGYSDDASGWTAVGKANLILDSLIDQGKARPMLIVMPLGYGAPEIVQRTPAFAAPFRNTALREKNFTNFRAALIDEVIPAVERMYKVDGTRDARAIAGLSMGGSESLLTGLNRLDKFSWVGAFSSGGLGEEFGADFPQLSSSANAQLHLLWIACGTEDSLIKINRDLVAWLQEKQIRLTPVETPGMHTWMVWRRNLIEFAPLLFRPAAATATPMAR